MMTRRHSPECASDLRLDRRLAGELSVAETAGLEAHLQDCAACRSRLEALGVEHRALSTELPPSSELGRWRALPRGTAPRLRSRASVWVGSLAAAAALCIAIVQRPWSFEDGAESGAEPRATRAKGVASEVRLDWLIRRRGEIFAPGAAERLEPGDALRFGLRTAVRGQAAVLSLDGAGRTSVYHDWIAVEGGERQLLPGAVELDDVLGEEHLYGIVCARVERLAELEQAIQSDPARPRLPAGCAVDHHVLRKERP
jgi:anti-sigma factor RsiW